MALRKWNREVFDVIQHKISRLQLALDAIQQHTNEDNYGVLERDLRGQFLEELKREEILSRSKSRVTWLITPDLNTKFFHISTIICRLRNCIDGPMVRGCKSESLLVTILLCISRIFLLANRPHSLEALRTSSSR